MNVSEVLDAAQAHLSKGRDAAAEKLFTEALEHPRGVVRAMRGLGTIALRAGDVDGAQDLFGRALALAPDDAGLLVGLAAVHLAMQREEEAETCLRRAMRLDPALPDAPANLALILLSRRDVEGARALARRAMALAPDSPDIAMSLANVEMLRGDAGAARTLLEKAAALAPHRADPLAGLGTLLQLTGDVANAAQSLERARLLEPDAPSILSRLAQCKVALGEFEAAQRLVRQAVAVAPADSEVRNAEGMVLLHSGCYPEALAALRTAAQTAPENPAPLVNLALLMRRNHQMEAALDAARQAIALDNGSRTDAVARRIEIDLLCLAGNWREAWSRHDDLKTLGCPPGNATRLPEAGLTGFGAQPALIVDDLSSSLMGSRLIPRLAAGGRQVRLLCLPAYASFFRALPGIDCVDAREAIDLSRDIETGETVVLLDDLPRLMRATPALLAPPGLGSSPGEPPPDMASGRSDPAGPPRVGLWWDDTPGGPDPKMLLNALPGTPSLLREPEPGQTPVLPDGRAPSILIDHDVEDLLDMARVLLSLDLVVAVDSPVAHLAATLGCRTVVICPLDIPWYWQPCGPDGARWYPTARAVARDPGGLWSTLTETCEQIVSSTDTGSQSAAAVHA